MAGILRRLLLYIYRASSPSHRSIEGGAAAAASSSFRTMSPDILRSIFSLLSPTDLASASLVCTHWLSVARDERLWENFLILHSKHLWPSVLFAETFLRYGIRSAKADTLSFYQVFRGRRQNPYSVTIDGGSGYCKFGWSSSNEPAGMLPTFLEFGNIDFLSYPLLKDFFSAVYACLQAMPSSQPVVISTPLCYPDDTETAAVSRRQLREVTYSVLFKLGAKKVCAVDQAILALYAAKHTSGIVVNIGFQATYVVPILHGKIMRHIGVEIVGQGAMQLNEYLTELMQQNRIHISDVETVEALKEKLCYVAQDYEAELKRDNRASCTIEDLGDFTLNQERFKASEILFRPKLAGLQTMGIHQAVSLCMGHCADFSTGDSSWYKTVILAGGTACLPGLVERLKSELCRIVPRNLSEGLNVIPPPEGINSVWLGAKLLSNLSTFQEAWCVTKKEYKKMGPSILHQKAFDEHT